MINVLVVEDSRVVREFLVHVLTSDPEVRVVGTVGNGEDAIAAVERIKPDVVTMDIHMPKMNGFDATRRIMETHPTPIVIVSGSSSKDELATTFHALEAGALAVVHRPMSVNHPDHETTSKEMIQSVKLMAEVKVVKRWARSAKNSSILQPATLELRKTRAEIRVVAIGASTGGPVVLHTILSSLPREFPVPILIVQHMAAGFTQGFVDWLARSCDVPIDIAAHGEVMQPGHVYLAPDGFQMGVDSGGRIRLSRDESSSGLCPSVSHLFLSIAEVYGSNAVGLLLTGMGKDGAQELKLMKDKGAITIAQDEETSVVHGMPGEAIRLDAAVHVLPTEKIAGALMNLVERNP